MSRALPWIELAVGLTEEDADILLDSFNAFRISKSDQAPCTVYTDSSPHNMRKRILRCSCKQCKLAMPYAKCVWRGKQLKCQRANLVELFQTGTHVTTRRDPRPLRLTRAMKSFSKRWPTKGSGQLQGRSYRGQRLHRCLASFSA
ncbi:hypothetical protein GQ600_9095 [Phytophthora cactorum]|nr:hypothetical protein GQ600_9095 [Phytophthora cactorum]